MLEAKVLSSSVSLLVIRFSGEVHSDLITYGLGQF